MRSLVFMTLMLFVGISSADQLLINDYWAGFRKPADYFVDDRDGFSGSYRLSDDGVLISIYRDRGEQYDPMFSAAYAISACREYSSTNEQQYLKAMTVQLDKLISMATARKVESDFIVWEYDFDIESYGLKAPWVSGLAQGRIAAAFICAFDVTKDVKYREFASSAIRAFSIDMDKGGVATKTPYGIYFEEIAKPGFRSTKVLNGHVSALQAVWLWAQVSRDPEFATLAKAGIDAVRADLAHYDAGFLSWYDQDMTLKERHIAPRMDYNNLHVTQLAWLYHVDKDPAFLDYALRFSGYEHPRLNFTASYSTNAKTNGPEKLGFFGYSNYWSSSVFPVSLDIDLGGMRNISGLHLWGYTEKASPKDFDILVSDDGKQYRLHQKVRGNQDKLYYGSFSPVTSRYVKTVIFSDNGNNNVALSGISYVGGNKKAQAISSRIRMTSTANRFFDSGFEMRAGEWLLIDNQQDISAVQRWIVSGVSDIQPTKFEWSSDLISWYPVKYSTVKVDEKKIVVELATEYAQYIRFTSAAHGTVVKIDEAL